MLEKLPKALLEDIINNRCVPIIGAGFSKNAIIPTGKMMPNWKELGEVFAKEMGETFVTATDSISAYEFEHQRPKLIEKLREFLLIGLIKPGDAHKSFCTLPFEIIITTNFDFLLEDGYREVNKLFHVFMDETSLSITPPKNSVSILKLHGDFDNPSRLIITEKDYDTFLNRYPLVSTFLCNQLISKTPLFIGYSIDDPDFRNIWQLIGDRMGELRRRAYCISSNANPQKIRRYKRRGVNVVEI